MLMDEAVVALNDVIVRCQAAAARYRDAAELTSRPELADRFQAAARERERAGERLEAELRAAGALPRDAESEIEELRTLTTHVRAALAQDETLVLVGVGEAAEDELAQAVGNAREHRLSDAVEAPLDELDTAVQAFRRDLAELRRAAEE